MDEYNARPSGRRLWPVVAVLALALVATAIPAVRHLREQPPPSPPPVRATWTAPADLVVGSGTDYPFGLALSPEGRRAVFAAARDGSVQLWLQDLSSGAVTALPDTDRTAIPFWSTDGTRVGFFADGQLKRLDVAPGGGGSLQTLVPSAAARGGTWNADGVILFAQNMFDIFKTLSGEILPEGIGLLFVRSIFESKSFSW